MLDLSLYEIRCPNGYSDYVVAINKHQALLIVKYHFDLPWDEFKYIDVSEIDTEIAHAHIQSHPYEHYIEWDLTSKNKWRDDDETQD